MTEYTVLTNLKITGQLQVDGDAAVVGDLAAGSVAEGGLVGVKCVKAGAITFAGTTETKLASAKLPAGALLLTVAVVVKTAFNDGTSNALEVGVSGDTDALMAAADTVCGTAGAKVKACTTNAIIGGAGGTDLYAKFAGGGSDATAGAADVYIVYLAL